MYDQVVRNHSKLLHLTWLKKCFRSWHSWKLPLGRLSVPFDFVAIFPSFFNSFQNFQQILVTSEVNKHVFSDGYGRLFVLKIQQRVYSDNFSQSSVFRIPCSCSWLYVGTTNLSIKAVISEHKRNSRPDQMEKSALTEHTLQENHTCNTVKYDDTVVLSTTSNFHHNNLNKKGEGLRLNRVSRPTLR